MVSDSPLDGYRTQLAFLDELLVDMLRARSHVVRGIAEHKIRHGLALEDRDQREVVLARVVSRARKVGCLYSPGTVAGVFDELLEGVHELPLSPLAIGQEVGG